METLVNPVSPLRQRMVEDMRMRKLAPKTQAAYIRAVRKFAKFLGHSPDTAPDELTRPNFVCGHCGAQMIVIESFVRGQAIRAPPAQRGSP